MRSSQAIPIGARCALLIAALGVSAVRAQTPTYFFSPPASNVLPGNSFSQVMVGSAAGYASRVQQIDANFVGNPLFRTITGIAFRGDEPGTPGAIGRSVELEVRMAHGDVATAGATFANNYVTPPVVVFPRGSVTAPDWSAAQAITSYSLEIQFQTPFVYNLTDDLLWEVVVYGTTNPGGVGGPYPQDFYSALPGANFSQLHVRLGPGCTTANGEFLVDAGMQSIPGTLGIGFGALQGPSNEGVVMLLGGPLFTQVPLPGFCAAIGTDAGLSFPIGVTDGAGNIPVSLAATPWSNDVAGIALSLQAVALDASQAGLPVAVSDSIVLSVPRTDGVPSLGCVRVFAQGTHDAAIGVGPSPSAVAVRYTVAQ